LDVAVQHAAGRVCEEGFHAAVAFLLEVARGACQRAAGARRAGEGVDLAGCLVPYLRPCGLDVCLAVCDVIELVCPDGIVKTVCVALGLVVVVLGVIKRDRGHRIHFRTQQAQQVYFPLRLGVGHVDDEVVAFGAADVGEAYACVARGAFDDGAPRLEEAGFLGVLDDEERRAVFYAAAGVLEFGFAEDGAAGFFGEGF
jgi:hypothetical protein